MHKFNKNIANIYGQAGLTWLNELPNRVQNIAKEYNIVGLAPINDLTYNYVMTGRLINHTINNTKTSIAQNSLDIILKLSFDSTALKKEAAALKTFNVINTPKIILEDEGLLLLERLRPGHALTLKSGSIKIACELMQQLHRNQTYSNFHFPHIKEQLQLLDHNWPIPIIYLTKARQLRDQWIQQLVALQPTVLLHGDLHYGNILRSGNSWKIIDPKGVFGQPINEVWAFVMDIVADTAYIANFFGFDLQLVRNWYFIHLIIAACHNIQDNAEPTIFMQLAQQAYKLVY